MIFIYYVVHFYDMYMQCFSETKIAETHQYAMCIIANHNYESCLGATQTFKFKQPYTIKVVGLSVNNPHSNIALHLI